MRFFFHFIRKNLSLILFLACIILFILFSVFLQELLFRYSSKNLNLIIISIDTLRADHMGVYGYKKNTTPNIDKFAKNATVFTNVSTVVPMTHPSFAALMTGQDMFKTRVIANQGLGVSENTKTLAMRLKEEGYITSAFVSNEGNLKQGFDNFQFHLFKYLAHNDEGKEYYQENKRDDYEVFLQKAGDWILQNKNRKFFTWIHLMDPHTPYFPPSSFQCKFNTKYCSKINGKTLDELDGLRSEFQKCQYSPVPKERVELMETLYDGGVATADSLVGKILARLKESGLDKNTIVVIYGDHGEGFDHNYYFNHGSVLYNSAIHIPFIVYHPLQIKNNFSNLLLQNTDILPTLLDLLQIPHNSTFSGNSFAYLFNQNPFIKLFSAKTRKYSFSADNSWTKFSINDGRYKYIFSLPGSCMYPRRYEELYDLKIDPNETVNIIDKNKQVGQSLRTELLKYLAQYNLPQVAGQTSTNSEKPEEGEDAKNTNENLKSLQY